MITFLELYPDKTWRESDLIEQGILSKSDSALDKEIWKSMYIKRKNETHRNSQHSPKSVSDFSPTKTPFSQVSQ